VFGFAMTFKGRFHRNTLELFCEIAPDMENDRRPKPIKACRGRKKQKCFNQTHSM